MKRSPRIPSYPPKGWKQLIDLLEANLDAVSDDWALDQVKEKFGGLRFYITYGDTLDEDERATLFELIRVAENRSIRTCVECGSPGTLRKDTGWRRTLCDACFDNWRANDS